MDTTQVISIIGGLVFGVLIGYFVRHSLAKKRAGSIEQKIESKLEDAEKKSKEIILKAEEKATSLLSDFRKQESDQKVQLGNLENRLIKREEILDKKLLGLSDEEAKIKSKEEELKVKEGELGKLKEETRVQLEKISGLSREEAKNELFKEIKETSNQDLSLAIQKIEKERRDEIEKKASEVIATALGRFARSQVAEMTTTSFHLPDEDLKGKIIGREGRNIRALERATGVELVIDETPDNIIISSFDPFRREVTRLALEKLIKDGRIQPAKIEEKVEEAKQELNKRIIEIGEAATMEVGIYDLPKELVQLIGRLHFRTSYGQNVLMHSIEMAHLAGMIAAELGLRVEGAKKSALLHHIRQTT